MQPLSLGMEVRCTGFCLGMWGRRGPGGASAAGQLAFLGAGTTAATARALGSGRRSSRGGLAEAKEAKTRLGFSCLVGGLCFVGVLWGRSRLCEACHLCSGGSGIRCSWVEAVAVGAACKGKGRCRGSKQWQKSVIGVGQTQKKFELGMFKQSSCRSPPATPLMSSQQQRNYSSKQASVQASY
jgi:hypothetical protein